jgi:hypothetical protein
MKKIHLILIVLLSLSLMNCSKVQMKPGNYHWTFTYDNPNEEGLQKFIEIKKSDDDKVLIQLGFSIISFTRTGNKVSGKVSIEKLNNAYLVGEMKNNTITGRFTNSKVVHSPGGGDILVETEGAFEITPF